MKNKLKYYGIKNNFLAIEEEYSNYKDSLISILPVPYEHTTSYGKGTSKGPKAILNASHYVEFLMKSWTASFVLKKETGSVHFTPLSSRIKQERKLWI